MGIFRKLEHPNFFLLKIFHIFLLFFCFANFLVITFLTPIIFRIFLYFFWGKYQRFSLTFANGYDHHEQVTPQKFNKILSFLHYKKNSLTGKKLSTCFFHHEQQQHHYDDVVFGCGTSTRLLAISVLLAMFLLLTMMLCRIVSVGNGLLWWWVGLLTGSVSRSRWSRIGFNLCANVISI